jgi:hypothetical protein
MLLIAIVTVAIVLLAANAFDIYMTAAGLKKHLAKDVNTFLIGATPSTRALCLRDGGEDAIILSGAVVGWLTGNPLAYGLYFSVALVFAAKHFIGGWKWRTLLHGGCLTPPSSAWGKFLGF